MYELKKNGKVFTRKFCWDRALVLWKKSLTGRGLTRSWETLAYSIQSSNMLYRFVA